MSKFSPPIPVMFKRPWGFSESRKTKPTPSFLKKAVRSRLSSCCAANGDGAGGCPFTGGGACMGAVMPPRGLSGLGGERLAGSW